MWRLQLGPPKNFQPIRNRSFNKELGVWTSLGPIFWLVGFDPKFFAISNGLLLAWANQRPKNLVFFRVAFLKVKVEIISVQLRIKQSVGLNFPQFVCGVLDLYNIGLDNLNVQSLKNLEPEESLKKYRMLMKCQATPHWLCFPILWTNTCSFFGSLVARTFLQRWKKKTKQARRSKNEASKKFRSKLNTQLRDRFIRFELSLGWRGKLRLLRRCLLDKNRA